MIYLNDYKKLINLDSVDRSNTILSYKERSDILDQLLKILSQKFNLEIDDNYTVEGKRKFFRAILNQLPPYDFDDDFFAMQDRLLTSETNEKTLIGVEELVFNNNIAMYRGDITTLQVDAIVNAGNSGLLGCFVPLHSCIDNIIISAAGFQVRNDLNVIMKMQGHEEPNGEAKITRAYNLPSKYIIHTVGPCIYGAVKSNDRNDLADCYINCLNLAREMGLHSIAFPCISTGEFHFPNDQACEIAIKSVHKWLGDNNYDIRVIFNVFKDIDEECYERRLQH